MDAEFEVLVAAKAKEKDFSKRVKRLEEKVKADFMADYRANGTDRKRSTVFDPKAAWLTMKGGKPSERVTRFQLVDPDAFTDWMDENRPETDTFAQANMAQFAEFWFHQTGECPDGCTVIEYDSEPVEPTPALTVKEDKVLKALDENPNLLAEVRQFMLGDGNEIG